MADFQCVHCCEDYELKGKKDRFGGKIVDGAYTTMIERLKAVTVSSRKRLLEFLGDGRYRHAFDFV